jgi:hypothetical protein
MALDHAFVSSSTSASIGVEEIDDQPNDLDWFSIAPTPLSPAVLGRRGARRLILMRRGRCRLR